MTPAHPLPKYKPPTPRMLDSSAVDSDTPQLQVAKKWMEDYHAFVMNKFQPLVSKNFGLQGPFSK